MLIEVPKIPTEGHFAMLWQHNSKAWGASFKWENKFLYIYSEHTNSWERDEFSSLEDLVKNKNAVIFRYY